MKKLLYITLFFTAICNAQIVAIPDANFKTTLLEASSTNNVATNLVGEFFKIDMNDDGEIQESEALNVSTLQISARNISNLTGIQSFINLSFLDCSFNQIIGELNLSNFSQLNNLQCQFNNFSLINTSNCNLLTNLSLFGNPQLTSINTSNCINLFNLNIYSSNTPQINSFPNLTSVNISNCSSITYFYIEENQLDTFIVSGCTGLTYLDVPNSQITSLDVSNLINLQTLLCFNNQLNSLNLEGCINLNTLYCQNNQITGTLNVAEFSNLTQLDFSNNLFQSVNASNCINLNFMVNYNNPLITSINFSGCTSLPFLDPFDTTEVDGANALVDVDITNCISLTGLYLNSPQLQTLNISGCTSLTYLSLYSGNLTSLNLSGFSNLTTLGYIGSLDSINLAGCINLTNIQLAQNQLTEINLTDLFSLTDLDLFGNLISTLDVSTNPNLTSLSIVESPVETIFAKNGINESIGFSNCPNLNFVCVDESQITAVQTELNVAGLTSTVCNSYCTFTPGGNYNTLSGNVKFDANFNGCDNLDSSQAFVRLNLSNQNTTFAIFTNSLGNYKRYLLQGNYSITPVIENPNSFDISPANATVNFPDNNNNIATQDFCISTEPPFTDVEIVIATIFPARPGFDATYLVTYKNKGNVNANGQISFTYNDAVLDFVSSTLTPTSQAIGQLFYSYSNLQPFESRSIYITLNVNSPQETPAVNIGDILHFSATVNSIIADDIPADNIFNYNQTVVGSYDPNDITCMEGDVVPTSEIGNFLHYVINFENTGTASAQNVVVKTEIDSNQFDINSLQLLQTSHQVDARITGNVVEFIFENIYLDTGGHGNVLLKVRSNNTLQQNDNVSKQANIYFDYNFPVETNLANTTFQTLSNSIDNIDNSISVYPNPTLSIVNINAKFSIKSVELYDVQGRLLQSQIINKLSTTLNISEKSNGIYFLKINSDEGSKIEQIVKE